MQNILKFLINILRVFLPGITITTLVTLYSLLGVFIEEEPLLILKGGFNNSYVSMSFFIISNLVAWIIVYYIFKYSKIFSRRLNYILVPIISTSSIVFFLTVYYILAFYYLTGLIVFEVEFIFSNTLEKTLAKSLLILLNSSILISLFANIIIILISRKNPVHSEEKTGEKVRNGDSESSNSSGTFEDSITI